MGFYKRKMFHDYCMMVYLRFYTSYTHLYKLYIWLLWFFKGWLTSRILYSICLSYESRLLTGPRVLYVLYKGIPKSLHTAPGIVYHQLGLLQNFWKYFFNCLQILLSFYSFVISFICYMKVSLRLHFYTLHLICFWINFYISP